MARQPSRGVRARKTGRRHAPAVVQPAARFGAGGLVERAPSPGSPGSGLARVGGVTPWTARVADVRPQLARLAPAPLVKTGLIYEPKYDGVRAAAGAPRTAVAGASRVVLAPQVRDDGRALLEDARAHGGEGVVVKGAGSTYRAGKRAATWRKVRLTTRQEFVVGGWTEPRGSRAGFGALLVGVWEGGGLRCVGRVGTGFDERGRAALAGRLAVLETRACPFSPPPAELNGRPRWVSPEIVVAVKFSAWTRDGMLRHPVFLGVRDDKAVGEVSREGRRKARAEEKGGADEAEGRAGRSEEIDAAAIAELVDQLNAIEQGRGAGTLRLPGGATLAVSNLRKVLWPAAGLTKGDLLRHYARVTPFILPVVRDRPLVMRRFPDGVDGEAFYQHRAPERPPRGVRVERAAPDDDVPARLIGGDLVTLLYMAQLACVSQDPWFSRVATPDFVDEVSLDLDPTPGVPLARVLDVARWLGDVLRRIDAPAFAKTSGATGLHIHVPMPAGTTYESGRLFAQIMATMVARRHPKVATVARKVAARGATVYIDYLQNVRGKTLACAYSARASDYAGASTPLDWREVHDVRAGVDPRAFTIATLPARLARVGDLWAGVREARRADLLAAMERLARLR